MEAYKFTTGIDKNGNLFLNNLPIRDEEIVEIIVLVNPKQMSTPKHEKRIEKLKNSFGSILSNVQISDEMLKRENIYHE